MTPILLDTIVLIVIMLSVIVSFFRGFIKEVLTIVNLLVAAVAAYILAPLLLPTFKDWFGAGGESAKMFFGVLPAGVVATLAAYVAVYFGVFVILSLAGMAISSGAKAMGLGPLDRGLGMVFGLLRGFLLVFVIYVPFAFTMQPDQLPTWARESISVGVLQSTYKQVDAYFKGGDSATVSVGKAVDEIEEHIDPNSLRGRLKKMSDEMMGGHATRDPEATQNVTDDIKREEQTRDILTDEEKGIR